MRAGEVRSTGDDEIVYLVLGEKLALRLFVETRRCLNAPAGSVYEANSMDGSSWMSRFTRKVAG